MGGEDWHCLVVAARVATGARWVGLLTFDPVANLVRHSAGSTLRTRPLRHAAAIWRGSGGPSLPRSTPGNANPCLATAFLDGRPVSAELENLARDVLNPEDISVATQIAGLRYTELRPLLVDNTVKGALAFCSPRRFSPAQLQRITALEKWATWAIAQGPPGDGRFQPAARSWLLRAEDRIRQEVAEELHGRVQTELLILRHQIQSCRTPLLQTNPDVTAQLAAIADRLDVLRDHTVRNLSHRLHPGYLKIGLRPALSELASYYETVMDITLDLADASLVLGSLSQTARLALYRLAEEALANALRHGHATHVTISLREWTRDAIFLQVLDNGRGFDSRTTPLGLGINAVAERIREAGGAFVYHSAPGAGAEWGAILPLRTERDVHCRLAETARPDPCEPAVVPFG
ncbi:MAG: hypothetical protein M0Z53_07830 [Thermaerobacter sp.]|nr:hypothetical protein [Thermaerobacter sp.]